MRLNTSILFSFAVLLTSIGVYACSGDSSNPPSGVTDGGDTEHADAASLDSGSTEDGEDGGVENDAASPADAGPELACDPTKPFAAPVEVVELNAIPSGFARLTPDMLTVYFHAGASEDAIRLYRATRTNTTEPFGTPTRLAGLTSGAGEGMASEHASMPAVTPNQLGLFFQSRRAGGGTSLVNLWSTSRTSTDAPFDAPTPVASLNDSLNTGQPFVTANGTSLYYSPRRGTGADMRVRIHRASLSGIVVNAPVEVAELTSSERNEAPVLSADELTIYFARDYTIWSASRPDTESAFANLAPAGIANETGNDFPSWISPDDCVLYLTSSRSGTNKIYTATRPR